MEKAAAEVGDLARSEEDIISYALFPAVARDFFQRRENKVLAEEEVAAAIASVIAKATLRLTPVRAGDHRETRAWRMAGREAQMRSRGWR